MSRLQNQRLRLLYLAKYMLEETDEEHALTVKEIIQYLASLEIHAERKTIYEDFKDLQTIGLDVQSIRQRQRTAYYIGERKFQLPELKLLVDVVQSSKFITERKSADLIQKLESLTSEFEARSLGRDVYVRGRIKSMNESIYYNVDEIQTAMEEDSSIIFKYFDWNWQRQRVLRHEGALYHVSPWALLWDNENYYLLAVDHKETKLKHYRVDKMLSIVQTTEKRQGKEIFEKLNMIDYTNTHFGMFSGDVQNVRLVFENSLAGAVIDRFGSGVIMIPQDDGEHFSVLVRATVNVQFFGWLSGFGSRVKIVTPKKVAEEMAQHCRKIAAMYDQGIDN